MKNLISLFAIFFTISASAANYTDMALEVGFRHQNGDVTGSDTNAKVGYQVGLSAAFPVADQWSIRSGLFYTQKNIEVESLVTKQDYKFSYVEIPATAMFKFTESAGAYAGINLSMNLDDDCGTGTCSDVESFVTPIVIGAAFKFAPQLGGNVYFETLSGDVANNVKDFKAIGANLMITFD